MQEMVGSSSHVCCIFVKATNNYVFIYINHCVISRAIGWLGKKQYTRDDEPTISCINNQDKNNASLN
jgi:hypothetical protein